MHTSTQFAIQDMPSMLARHKLSQDDYKQILAILGREPNLVELGIFSAMWSEHCSYKSSKIYLKDFPTSAPWVIQGPGENAGVIDIGGGYSAIFKVESHNHPSFIEPYAGAATGVGGIMRDIFTMGARPVASLNSIRFGAIWRKDSVGKRHKYLLSGVVAGIGGYGNCMGVPTIGGETSFESCYNGNILVNAFCLGIAKSDEIFYGRAQGVGNPVLYVGSKTGRDGLGGAVMSSDSFSEDSKSLRPTVQVGDPFTEKLLLEACLELFRQDLIVGIQDMGAAGLTSSSFEMAGRAGSGMRLDLDKVPMRENHMNAYELMLSESQERMLICAKKGTQEKIKAIFAKWELDCAVIGEVTQSGAMELFWQGEQIAHIPISPIVQNAPILHLPTKEPDYIAKVRSINPLESILQHTAHLEPTAILCTLLSSLDICDKEWIYAQYDSSVQTNTMVGSGQGEGSVIRIKENDTALGMSIHAPIRYCYLNPKEGSKIAVARAGRKCVTRGIKPLAISDCLNFGNPNNPEVMWQFKESCEGIKLAAQALETPIVSGNVSLYNQTNNNDIYPSPTIVSVGVAQNKEHIIDSALSKEGNTLILLGNIDADFGGSVLEKLCQMGVFEGIYEQNTQDITPCGDAPQIDLAVEKRLWNLLLTGIGEGIICSAKEVGEGGLGIALTKMAIFGGKGYNVHFKAPDYEWLFAQSQSCVVIEVAEEHLGRLKTLAQTADIPYTLLGEVQGKHLRITLDSSISRAPIVLSLDDAQKIFFESFEKHLANTSAT